MEDLLELLSDCCPGVDFPAEGLIDQGLLDSLHIVTITGELMLRYGVKITPADLLPENFNSVAAIWALVRRKRDGG